jgi:hypothetical protein
VGLVDAEFMIVLNFWGCPTSTVQNPFQNSTTNSTPTLAERPARGHRSPSRLSPLQSGYGIGATFPRPGFSNDKIGFSKKGLSPLDLPPGLIRTVLSSREPPRAQISIRIDSVVERRRS